MDQRSQPITPAQLYNFSLQLDRLRKQAQGATEWQAGRYKYFVDGSTLGHQCTYAVLCAAEAQTPEEQRGLTIYLEQTKLMINQLLATLESDQTSEPKD